MRVKYNCGRVFGNFGPTAFGVFIVLVLAASAWGFQVKTGKTNDDADPLKIGGTYAGLQIPVRRLVENWFRQFNELAKRSLDPARDYERVALSTRTTFEAVTNALMRSELADANGESMGTALDIIDYVETVHGKVPNARGDLQFRIYVALKPNALEILERSQTFSRGRNNTVYHKGYPLNYRQNGGVPSIQISPTKDGRRADIDVDYRSSTFPMALYNGHLTAGNSDVRAGKNYDRHVNRWSGLVTWWKDIFGVSVNQPDWSEDAAIETRVQFPRFPRKGKEKFDEAVKDFLYSWLVEKQPRQSVAYVSPRAFACIDRPAGHEAKPLNVALAPYHMLAQMERVISAVGSPSDLSKVVEGVRLDDEGLRVYPRGNSAQFVLYEVPDDIAYGWDCGNRNSLEEGSYNALPKRQYRGYYGAAFRIKTPKALGLTVRLLIARESGYWKVVSWQTDPDGEESATVPDIIRGPAQTEKAIPTVEGDPGMMKEARDFFDTWFIERNYERAVDYLSSNCYRCLSLYGRPDEEIPGDALGSRRRLKEGLEAIAKAVVNTNSLDQAIKSVALVDPDFSLVDHPDRKSYTLFAIPDRMAPAFMCDARVHGNDVSTDGPPVLGNYYATSLQLNAREELGTLVLLWGKEEGRWKIVSYSIELP